LPKPRPEILLGDEFVQEDTGDFLPDDLVVEETVSEATVTFAGPSDAPPANPSPQPPVVPRETSPAKLAPPTRWLPLAAAAAFGFLAAALVMRAHRPEPPPTASQSPAPPVVESPAPHAPEPEALTALAPAAAPASVAPSTPPSAAGPVSNPVDPAALTARQAAQSALEHGHVAQAITLGEQSVQLDPTEAQGWLILGAAYLQRGSFPDARRCFSSCVKQATHGAKSECAALLR
jgi:hypothetical protein